MKSKHTLYFNAYLNSAHLYDTDNRDRLLDDISFYLEEAHKVNGPILELACGTGRVSIPLAQAGKKVVGIDISPPMLKVFSEKLKKYPIAIQNNINIYKADITNFELNKKFDLIILPFSTFQVFCDNSQVKSCLNSVRRCLNQEGVFIFNCFNPQGFLDETWCKKDEDLDYTIYDENGQKILERKNLKSGIDTKNQIIYVELIYDEFKNSERINRTIDKLKMKYYYPSQLIQLLTSNNFEILERYGYYDRRALEPNATQMIFKIKPQVD